LKLQFGKPPWKKGKEGVKRKFSKPDQFKKRDVGFPKRFQIPVILKRYGIPNDGVGTCTPRPPQKDSQLRFHKKGKEKKKKERRRITPGHK